MRGIEEYRQFELRVKGVGRLEVIQGLESKGHGSGGRAEGRASGKRKGIGKAREERKKTIVISVARTYVDQHVNVALL